MDRRSSFMTAFFCCSSKLEPYQRLMSKMCSSRFKKSFRDYFFWVACFFAPLSVASAQAGLPSFNYSTASPAAIAVTQARQAVASKQTARLPGLAAQAQGDVLQIYAEYWVAEQAVVNARSVFDVPVAQAFLERYPDTYPANKIKAAWVLASAKSGAFLKIREIGEFPWMNKQVRCAKLEARHMIGQRATAAEAVEEFAPGEVCWSMLDQFVADGVLSRADLLPLLLGAIERNQVRVADRLAGSVFDRATLATYRDMMKGPANFVRNFTGKAVGDNALIVAMGLARMGRESVASTYQLIDQSWANRLPAPELGWVRAQLAQRAALNLDPQADRWYRQAGNVELTPENHAWRVRAALRQPKIDWSWVMQSIDWMPADLREDAAWQYWRARALAASGNKNQALAIYKNISGQYNFYGQLALEELGQKISAPKPPAPVTPKDVALARGNPHLQQAVALFKLGFRADAVPQWNYALTDMTDNQLRAAAEFAREQEIFDRVVNTSERTQNSVDFSQRFIAPFEARVREQADSIDLDPAWVFGLIRQESRFIMDARSVVGASGLMQLMPATAKYVAKRVGMTDFAPHRVNEFDVNTKLGTHYLRIVLNDLGGSQVLASAGYNAGPGRPTRWRATLGHPVEGAIFAETIPFNETRDYVKSVLSNATYYAAVFSGQPQSLKQRLGQISPGK